MKIHQVALAAGAGILLSLAAFSTVPVRGEEEKIEGLVSYLESIQVEEEPGRDTG